MAGRQNLRFRTSLVGVNPYDPVIIIHYSLFIIHYGVVGVHPYYERFFYEYEVFLCGLNDILATAVHRSNKKHLFSSTQTVHHDCFAFLLKHTGIPYVYPVIYFYNKMKWDVSFESPHISPLFYFSKKHPHFFFGS